jgi:uncharacterized protein
MKKVIVLCFSLCSFGAMAQNDSIQAVSDILAFQTQLNKEFKNKEESPLEPKDFKKFKSLPFFPINLAFRVNAKIIETPGTPVLQLKTTTTRLANDRVYGFLEFTINGKAFRLPVYQSPDLMKQAEYADYLFFPFTDLTNGKESYTGGRYIDLRIPKDGRSDIVIDFNKAYNPSCAYSHRYSCPIVPAENQMDIEVPAGVMHHHK